MGSTGEADRKRRHFSSLSPTAVHAKKQPFLPVSEEKKHNTSVLQYQNQKLLEKLEAQKLERPVLENKFFQLEERQKPYNSTLKLVNESWKNLLSDLESCSVRARESSGRKDCQEIAVVDDEASPSKDAFLSRLTETGATENSFSNYCNAQMEEDGNQTNSERTRNILHNIVTAISDLWHLKDGVYAAIEKELPDDGPCKQKTSNELVLEVKNLRFAISDLHLKHKFLAKELQTHRDMDARNKAKLRRLKGELESAVAELEESNCSLASLKAERDATKGAFFPVLNVTNKHASGEKVRDRQRDLQDMQSTLKDLLDQASSRLVELKGLHEERMAILQKLSSLQNILKSVKCLCSSKAYLLVQDQLEKSKTEVSKYQALLKKLQVEKDTLAWKEKELSIKTEIVDVFRRSMLVADSRSSELGREIEKQIDERKRIEAKLEEALEEPGRKEIIAEFKSLLSSFPEEMSAMQSQLSKCKEAAADIHSLRADVKLLSGILDKKTRECETLSSKYSEQDDEVQSLRAMVHDLKESDLELKLIVEMYRRESTDSRDVLEAKDLEYKAWAHVQSLKHSLDEQNLELRVKMANEAEAISQQMLAAAEAEIADLRQKLEASKRDKARLSDTLKSKNEENESYLSEIETIGQAYDDMQAQNQQLLQQITERDDYNIKLVMEGVKAKQLRDALLLDKNTMERNIQEASASLDFYDMKAARIEDQLRFCSDQVHKLAEDRFQNNVALENAQKRLLDVRRSSHQARESLEGLQYKTEKSRGALAELQIGLERERFNNKRIEEELEVARRKVSHLRMQIEGSSVLEKLKQELKEYKDLLKCSICLDRRKQVVIAKCYHLFCHPCVQKIAESRHRKCPTCGASFGAHDIRHVYI